MFDQLKKQIFKDEKRKRLIITIGWVSVVLLVLILAASSGAKEPPAGEALSTATDFNIGEMVIGTIIRLLLVLALIYGLFSIYKLFQKSNVIQDKRRIQLLDTHRFSQKQAVVILRVDGEEFLIGLTDHQITLLKTLENGNQEETASGKPGLIPAKPFKDYLDEHDQEN